MNWLGRPFPIVAVLLAYTTKTTVVLALSWIMTGALRRWSAAQRHRVWTAGILGSLMLPLLSMLTPQHYSGAIANTIGGAVAHWVP